MRRVLTAGVVAGALLVLGACGTSSGSDEPTPAADYSANTATVCDGLDKLLAGDSSLADIEGEMVKALKGTSSSEQIEEIQRTALVNTRVALSQWADGIGKEAANAEDPQLKAAILAFAGELGKAASGIESLDDVDKFLNAPELAVAGDKLDQICK